MAVAISKFSISIMSAMIVSELSEEFKVKQHISFMLSILPKGTECVGVRLLPIVSLSKQYEIDFEHPAFEEGMTIETDWTRTCWRSTEEEIEAGEPTIQEESIF